MQKSLFAVLVISALLLSACSVTIDGKSASAVRGSGNIISESRNVSSFSSVEFTGLGEIIISQGSSESLTIEAEDNIMPLITTNARDGVLTIGFERQNWQNVIVPSKTIKFMLSVKDLSSIESSGLGSIQAPALRTNKLSVKLMGAGSVKLGNLDVTSLNTLVAGAGSLELSGKASDQTVTLSGLGSYRAGDLSSSTAKITLSGAGGATVWPQQTLDVTITGAGSISYYGAPVITKTITGIGSVKSLGAK